MASDHSVPRQTLYRLLEPFVETELIEQSDDGFKITGAGEVFLQAYETANQIISTDVIGFIAASPNRKEILRRVSEQPSRKSELTELESSPSRSTVQRILSSSESYGLVVRNNDGAYALTESGSEALDAFETLVIVTEQSVEKVKFLNQLGETSTDLPCEALEAAELVTITESDPHAIIGRTAELLEERGGTISTFRGLTPVFSPHMFKMFKGLADRNTEIEMMFDATAFSEAKQPRNFPYFIGPLVHPNVDLRIYPKRVPFGIGLFDDLLMLVAYLDVEKDEVAIVSEDERLVSWAENRFESYWEAAQLPSERLRDHVQEYLGEHSTM